MRLLSKNTQVRQGRALERHYLCFLSYSAVLFFMRGYAEEEKWPDMANGHWPSIIPGTLVGPGQVSIDKYDRYQVSL
jgi:hypothetical protein